MRERYIDIEFDEEGKGPSFAGSVVRLNECVNILRVKIRNLDDPGVTMQVAIRRADGAKAFTLCKKKKEAEQVSFSYALSSWATAIPGELRLSFSLIYPEAYKDAISSEGDSVYEVYPIDYQRLVTLNVEPSVAAFEPVELTPDIAAEVIVRLAALEEGQLRVGSIDGGYWSD